jgi:chromosome segregation ATPase
MKAENQIKHKEEMGDDLKFIDFHQLQIENKKHVKDIDERNKKLLALKLNSGKTVQTLNSLKKKLKDQEKEQDSISKDMLMKRHKYERTKDDIKKAREEIDDAKDLMKRQKNLQLMIKDMPDPLKFVDQKNTAVDLRNSVKNWERKLEIAEVAAKKARNILRQVGEHVDEIIRPDFLQATGAGHH